jgi:glutamate transport system substrate-binding protein
VTDEEAQQEMLLHRALHRYTARFKPVKSEWARIEAREAGATRRHGLGVRPRPAVALTVIIAFLAATGLIETLRPRRVFVDPVYTLTPQYHEVTPPIFAPGTTMAAIQREGVLRVGIKFDQPGFGFRDPRTGQVQGFDVEIAKLIGIGIFGGSVQDLGPRIKFIETRTAQRERLLQEGEVDIVVATYTMNEEREQQVDFAGPYFVAQQDIMVRKDDDSIGDANDLGGRKVCTVGHSTSESNLKARVPLARVITYDTYSKCAQALLKSEVEAVTTDKPILAGYVVQSRYAFRLIDKPFSYEPYGIGLKKGDRAFQTFLNSRLEKIESNSDWNLAAESLSGVESALRPPPIQRHDNAGRRESEGKAS